MAMGGLRPWKVIVDGAVTGTVEPGRHVELPVTPGQHMLRIQWSALIRSSHQSFAAREGDVVDFSCHSRPFGALVVPFSLLALFKHDIWIALAPDGSL
jgi:hypothetical protein